MTAAVKLEMTSFYGSLKCSESFKFIAESPIMNLKRLKTHWSISSITIGTPPDAPPDVLAGHTLNHPPSFFPPAGLQSIILITMYNVKANFYHHMMYQSISP